MTNQCVLINIYRSLFETETSQVLMEPRCTTSWSIEQTQEIERMVYLPARIESDQKTK